MEAENTMRFWARAFTREVNLHASAAGYAELASLAGDETLQPRQMVELSAAGPTARVAVGSANGDWIIQSMAESLDVMHTPAANEKGLALHEFCARAARQLMAVLEHTGARTHRIAVLWERLLAPVDSAKLDAVADKVLVRPDTFTGTMFEWDWRVAVRLEREFGDHKELTNTLATVRRVEARTMGQPPADRILLTTDVNTMPQRIASRFGASDVRAFVEAAESWHDDLTAEVKAHLEVT